MFLPPPDAMGRPGPCICLDDRELEAFGLDGRECEEGDEIHFIGRVFRVHHEETNGVKRCEVSICLESLTDEHETAEEEAEEEEAEAEEESPEHEAAETPEEEAAEHAPPPKPAPSKNSRPSFTARYATKVVHRGMERDGSIGGGAAPGIGKEQIAVIEHGGRAHARGR